MNTIKLETITKMERLLMTASDETRLKIMFSLLNDDFCKHHKKEYLCSDCDEMNCSIEKCVNDIAAEIGASQSLVSHQLKVLKDADLVANRKEGTKVYYSLKDKHIRMLLGVAYEHVMEDKDHE